MYIVNSKTDLRKLGVYLNQGQLLEDEVAERYLKLNHKLNITKQKDVKEQTKQKKSSN